MYKKLLKRLLPVVLSVAMVVQSTPETVFAAETVTLTETVEESATESGGDASSEEGEAGEQGDTAPADTTEDSAPAENTADTAPAESTADTTAPETETTQNQEELVQDTTEQDIVLEYSDDLQDGLTYDLWSTADSNYDNYIYHAADHSFTTDYDKNGKGTDFSRYVTGKIGEDNISPTWKMKDGENYVPITDPWPKEVGTYYLEFSSTKTSKVNRETKMIIEKADLTIDTSSVTSVVPETTVAKVIEQIKGEISYSAFYRDAKDYVASTAVVIKEVGSETALGNEDKLSRAKDYIAVITPTLTEDGAKILAATSKEINIQFLGLKSVAPYVVYTQKDENTPVYEIERIYTGEAVVAPDMISDKKEVTVTFKDGENAIVTTEDEISTAWYDESKKELEAAPVDAGTYYYGVTFTDQEKVYATTTADIKVVIKPKTLYLKPVTDATFYEGMQAGDILDTISYKVYTDKEGKEEFTLPSEYFWGISPYRGNEQPCEPTFMLEYKVTAKDKTTVIKDWDDYYGKVNSTQKAQGSDEEYYFYRVRPTMNKVAHHPDDHDSDFPEWDINSTVNGFTGNYKVVDLEAYYLPVEVEDINATIDVSAILEALGGKGADVANRATKIYDTNPIFTKKADYKKAVVKSGTTEIVKDGTDSTLYYRWIRGTIKDGKFVDDYSTVYTPSYVGVYALEVSYDDPSHKYTATPVRIYFEIEKQKLLVKFAQDIKVSAGSSGTDLDINKESYTIYKCKENKADEASLVDTGWKYEIDDFQVSVCTDSTKKDDITAYEPFPYDGTFVKEENTFYKVTATEFYSINDDCYKVECEPVNVVVEARGNKGINIKANLKEKVYDGEPYDITGLITMKHGDTTVDLPVTYFWTGYTTDGYSYESTEAPVNAGEYTLTVTCEGNEEYAYAKQSFYNVTIEQKPIEIEQFEIVQAVAGERSPIYRYGLEDAIVEKDKDLITFHPDMNRYEKGSSDETNDYLRYGVTYVASLNVNLRSTSEEDEYGNWYCVARNYKVISKTCEFTVDKRGNSQLGRGNVTVKDTIDGMKHTIVPMESIPHMSSGTEDTNVIRIRINKPNEFNANGHQKYFNNGDFVYANSIKQAGGVIDYKSSNYIQVSFDASAKDKKEFEITWETGYTETFVLDLEKAVLEVDKTKAVAPKSLAFNSPKTKMVVGEIQELDVKLTKTLPDDVVILNYKVDEAGSEVLHIDEETGAVVALKKGTATVTVYPVVWNRKTDKFEEIPMKKAVTTKITVSDVSAPKITSVVPSDDGVQVNYQNVTDGWRKELFIAEGKLSQADFEKKIDAVKNGDYKAQGIICTEFAINTYDFGKKLVTIDVSYILEPSKEYTVYIRQVSWVRELGDGCQVSKSAAGTVKSFTTIKPQAISIELHSHDDNGWVDLSEKNVQLFTTAVFRGSVKDPAKDYYESDSYILPMDKSEEAYYSVPKITYTAYSYYAGHNNKYNVKSKIATIDKNGKVSLKGIGTVIFEVYDSVSGLSDTYTLDIGATLNKISAKSVTLKVGESINLDSLVTVYCNGKKISNEYGALPVSYSVTGGGVSRSDNTLKALEPGKTVTVTATVKSIDDATNTMSSGCKEPTTTTFTIKTKEMDKIKDLKAYDKINYTSKVGFYHAVYADSYKIGLKDGRGSVLTEQLVSSNDIWTDYDTKKKAHHYTFDVNGITGYRLARLADYTVTVTPVINGTEGSSISCKFKTTDIPARYTGLATNEYGGLNLRDSSLNVYSRSDSVSVKSGNKLTLTVRGAVAGAKESGSDTLIWKVSDTKIATVQSGKGVASYTITLRGVKAGTTTLTATSSITKKVVMRRRITVTTVGSADTKYGGIEAYGEQEKYTTDEVEYQYQSISINSSTYVSLQKGEIKYYRFVPSWSGNYELYSYSNTGDPKCVLYDEDGRMIKSDDDGGDGSNFSLSANLTRGKAYYYAVFDYFGEESSMYIYLQ